MRWRVLGGLVAAAAALGAGWLWLNRVPAIDLTCPGGAAASAASLSTIIGAGHGVMGASLSMQPDGAELSAAFGPTRHLGVSEREAVLERMRRPGAAARKFAGEGPKTVRVEVVKTCGAHQHTAVEEVELGRQHPNLASWLAEPGNVGLLWTVIAAEVADRDPHAHQVAATAAELLFAAYPGRAGTPSSAPQAEGDD